MELDKFMSNATFKHFIKALMGRPYDDKTVQIRVPSRNERVWVPENTIEIRDAQRDSREMTFFLK